MGQVGGNVGWQRVSFLTAKRGHPIILRRGGADIVFDTRVGPILPRNAVYGRAVWEHIAGVNRAEFQSARLSRRLIGQTVFAVRAQRTAADSPLPPYLKPLLGGMASHCAVCGGHCRPATHPDHRRVGRADLMHCR
mgnify:CR=1 FL=1